MGIGMSLIPHTFYAESLGLYIKYAASMLRDVDVPKELCSLMTGGMEFGRIRPTKAAPDRSPRLRGYLRVDSFRAAGHGEV